MNMAIRILLVVCFLSVFAYADETVREFSFKTVDGKTIEYKAASRSPMIVSIGAHW